MPGDISVSVSLSRLRYLALIAGLSISGYGVLIIASALRRPSNGGVVILVLYALLILGLGVVLSVVALVREEVVYPPKS